MTYRYSQWDGSQDLSDLDADQLMDELEKLMSRYQDLNQALRAMQRNGFRTGQGQQMPSLQRLMERLRRMRENQLDRYNLSSIMDDIRQKLDDILKTERDGIQKQLDDAAAKAQKADSDFPPEVAERLRKSLEERATRNKEKLDSLPPDVGGQVKELTQYDFMDGDARQKFQELLDQLKKNAMQSYMRNLTNQLKGMDAQSIAGVRNMIEAINQMVEARQRGEEPDFDSFMQQFGGMFGDNPPKDLDELMQRLSEQMAQAEALLESLSPEDRQQLEELLNSMFDDATQREMAKLAANVESMFPRPRRERGYPFTGEESVSYQEALRLMEELQKMDKLDRQMQGAQTAPNLDGIDEKLLKELLGDKAANELDAIKEMARKLEEAGYIRKKGNRYELTPEGMRRIGHKALKEIFSQLKKDRFGPHVIDRRGHGVERIEETRKYEFGDDFYIHVQKTIMNSLRRQGGPPPVKIEMDDFEVLQTEESTRTATVLMLDHSMSMFMNGCFDAARRVAIALDSLITSRFPQDSLHVVVFSARAREVKKQDLVYMAPPYFDQGTNFQDALRLARKLLAGDSSSNKEVIIVSDGEPTAHIENGQVYFQYPPSLRTLQLTLREVKACTAQGIVINTFMFDRSPFYSAFINQLARINKGRVFLTSSDDLGSYLLMDYLTKKKTRLQ